MGCASPTLIERGSAQSGSKPKKLRARSSQAQSDSGRLLAYPFRPAQTCNSKLVQSRCEKVLPCIMSWILKKIILGVFVLSIWIEKYDSNESKSVCNVAFDRGTFGLSTQFKSNSNHQTWNSSSKMLQFKPIYYH